VIYVFPVKVTHTNNADPFEQAGAVKRQGFEVIRIEQ